MPALHYLSYVAGFAAFVFVLLSLASGLLYIAEVIEEHPGLAKTVGKRLIFVEILLYLALGFCNEIPWYLVAVGVVAHIVYLGNFSRNWPSISLTSVAFLSSVALVLLSHFLSFRHFSARTAAAHHHRYTHYNAYNRHGSSSRPQEPTFLDVATYFAVCVWLVPFYLFLSLSANDNVLPSSGEAPTPAGAQQPSKPGSKPPSSPSPSAPPSPALSHTSTIRHTRQRSSMMKSALSSAFSIVPSVLRPSTLQSQLQLPHSHPNSPNMGRGAPRNDLPRSPSPSFGFRPYESTPSLLSTSQTASWAASVPTSPTASTHTTGLGFSTSSSTAHSPTSDRFPDRSGGALASPSLAPAAGRTLNFAPAASSPQASPLSPSFPAHPFAQPPGAGAAATSAGMARRHTGDRAGQGQQAPQGLGALPRRASEAVLGGGAYAGRPPAPPGGARQPGLVRRGTDLGPGGGGGGRV
ncbi:hypothetical protein JCM10207_004690 [Rhodosporidiobolus poonsookiae]